MERGKISFAKAIVISTSILIVLALVVVSFYLSVRINSVVKKNTEQKVDTVIQQTNMTLEYLLSDLMETADALNTDRIFLDYIRLEQDTSSTYEHIKNDSNIEKTLHSAYQSSSILDNMVFYTPHNTHFASRKNVASYLRAIPTEAWYREVTDGTRQEAVRANYMMEESETDSYLLLAKRVYDFADAKYMGVVLLAMPMRAIGDIWSSTFSGNDASVAFLADEGGRVIYSGGLPGAPERNARFYDDQHRLLPQQADYHTTYAPNPFFGWGITCFTSKRALTQDAAQLRMELLAVTLLLCVLNILIVSYISKRITRPLTSMCQGMDQVSQGVLDTRMPDERYAELSLLSRHFNRMVEQIHRLLSEVKHKEREKQRAEVQVLEAQINPHFIYNTLEAVKWVALAHKAPVVPQMITALVKLMSVSISTRHKTISLREEREYLENYLLLIGYRYNTRHEVCYRIPPHLEEATTLKMVLQPLVENAVFHGLREGTGHIEVTAEQQGGMLVLAVRDDGVGFEPGELQQEDLPKRKNAFSGIALHNIDHRIKLHCGEDYGIEIRSKPGVGTTVLVYQPYREGTA